MATYSFEGFYLGTFADFDPYESYSPGWQGGRGLNTSNVFGSGTTPLSSNSISDITVHDLNNDRALYVNNQGAYTEPFQYQVNGVTHSATLDSIAAVEFTVRFLDGTTQRVTLGVAQLTDGAVLTMPPVTGSTASTLLASKPVELMQVYQVLQTNYSYAYFQNTQFPDLARMPDGVVQGTGGGDLINSAYTGDPTTDRVDGGDHRRTEGNNYTGVQGSDDDYIRAYGGNDTVFAGAGNDTVEGGAGADRIYGGTGNDLLYGDLPASDDNASDTIYGEGGNDTIWAQGGDDMVDGGDGNDVLHGGAGYDTLLGGSGNDFIDGGDDDDDIDGGPGDDTLYGGSGHDTIEGGDGRDFLQGGVGNDALYGGADDDFLDGSGDNDYLSGGTGNDTLYGGTGNDTLRGDEGDDLIHGEEGDDYIEGGYGSDTIYGGDGHDTIRAEQPSSTTQDFSPNYVDGGSGNDAIYGSFYGTDTLIGGTGDDTIRAYGGNDRLEGGDGNDIMAGGDGNDLLLGGAGNDTLYGEGGNDTLDGGAGNDYLHGGFWAEATLTGGEGFDTFYSGSYGGVGPLITDFNTGSGQNISDGIRGNNDFVDLSSRYNATNLATINAAREAAGLPTFSHALGWLRADQDDDGVLNDIRPENGFSDSYTITIQNNGSAVPGSELTWDNTNVLCFADDTLIETGRGARAIGGLRVGDLVMTRDAGLQPIRWIGSRTLNAATLVDDWPRLCPIRIAAGALGAGVPRRDLVVSPQHRILVRSKIARRMFGADEILVAAKHLCQIEGIRIADDLGGVTYVHLMFDAHHILLANGAEAELLFTGPEAMKSLAPAARDEIRAIFPDLDLSVTAPVAARALLSGRMGRELARRHAKNGKPLVS